MGFVVVRGSQYLGSVFSEEDDVVPAFWRIKKTSYAYNSSSFIFIPCDMEWKESLEEAYEFSYNDFGRDSLQEVLENIYFDEEEDGDTLEDLGIEIIDMDEAKHRCETRGRAWVTAKGKMAIAYTQGLKEILEFHAPGSEWTIKQSRKGLTPEQVEKATRMHPDSVVHKTWKEAIEFCRETQEADAQAALTAEAWGFSD